MIYPSRKATFSSSLMTGKYTSTALLQGMVNDCVLVSEKALRPSNAENDYTRTRKAESKEMRRRI